MSTITINGETIYVKDLSIDFNNNEIHIIENDISSKTYSFLFRHILLEKFIDDTSDKLDPPVLPKKP